LDPLLTKTLISKQQNTHRTRRKILIWGKIKKDFAHSKNRRVIAVVTKVIWQQKIMLCQVSNHQQGVATVTPG